MATLEELEAKVNELEEKVNAILVKMATPDAGWTDEYEDADKFIKEAESGESLVDWLNRKGIPVKEKIAKFIAEAVKFFTKK